MKSILALLLSAFVLFGSVSAFSSTRPAMVPRVSLATRGSTSLNMVFGNRKSAADKAAEKAKEEKYWQGEWVCKDCGYIYQRVCIHLHFFLLSGVALLSNKSFCCVSAFLQAECAGLYFEEQGPGFRCPQCSGPRRRYAKKVGDRVGTTLDGGDAPILIFSFGGVALTIAFGIWAINNL